MPDVIEMHAPAGRERLVHRVGLERLDADHLHVGPKHLEVTGNAGDETAAANRHEHGEGPILAVLQDLRADRPLPCNDERIVERMDECQAGLRHHQSQWAFASA